MANNFKNLLIRIELARVIESVTVSLSMLLPAVVSAFQAAAAETRDFLILLVTEFDCLRFSCRISCRKSNHKN